MADRSLTKWEKSTNSFVYSISDTHCQFKTVVFQQRCTWLYFEIWEQNFLWIFFIFIEQLTADKFLYTREKEKTSTIKNKSFNFTLISDCVSFSNLHWTKVLTDHPEFSLIYEKE
jgi:hypothetical protein